MMASTWDVTSDLISWALAGAGFWVAWRQAHYFARRSEIKTTVEESLGLVREALAAAIEYWQLEPSCADAKRKGTELQLIIDRLEERLNLLWKADRRFTKMNEWLKFKQQLTGGMFQSARRQPLKREDDRLQSMTECSAILLQELEEVFWAHYHRITVPLPFRHSPHSL